MIAIGVLFLLTDGTANLGGIFGVGAAYDVQIWLERFASAMSAPAIALAVALALLAWRGHRLWRRTRTDHGGDSRRANPQSTDAQRIS